MAIYESTKAKVNSSIYSSYQVKKIIILSFLAQIQFTVQRHVLGLVHYLTSFIF